VTNKLLAHQLRDDDNNDEAKVGTEDDEDAVADVEDKAEVGDEDEAEDDNIDENVEDDKGKDDDKSGDKTERLAQTTATTRRHKVMKEKNERKWTEVRKQVPRSTKTTR
jgi:hypothetical protein